MPPFLFRPALPPLHTLFWHSLFFQRGRYRIVFPYSSLGRYGSAPLSRRTFRIPAGCESIVWSREMDFQRRLSCLSPLFSKLGNGLPASAEFHLGVDDMCLDDLALAYPEIFGDFLLEGMALAQSCHLVLHAPSLRYLSCFILLSCILVSTKKPVGTQFSVTGNLYCIEGVCAVFASSLGVLRVVSGRF